MRSRKDRIQSQQLAVPSRSPHRCIRPHPESLARRIIRMPTPASGSTPVERGLWMPAEWEHHEATWLAWPHEQTDWPGKLPAIPWPYADILRHLSPVARVSLLLQNPAADADIRCILTYLAPRL